ncbi:alpha/beta hydrolase [Mariniflexile sp. AS56]|uniref:alpha/beta hydrolase n=1 Tax=Mariniflexile sp. AS56 TaxID=3063957 RepID=UPI0026F04BE2|nr:alpha/beta hydrolase [Mariniflexile sp. AS56]MDO7171584.1 alpha/beta hydrolase [Mariniflexile sp. AS56]
MIKYLTITCLAFLTITQVFSQNTSAKKETPPKEVVYKEINGTKLKLSFYYPESFNKNEKYPTMIFFFGGGWNGGTTAQFNDQATYFASRGLITVLADYRVKNKHKTTPFDAVRDAKSAMRFLRIHADEFCVDSNKIIASGGSAGGHLAAATTMLPELNEAGEDLSISTKANALVLFNPVIDNGEGGYGYERIGDRYLEISPMHNITKGAPPTIFFLGDTDKYVPAETGRVFKTKMEAVGSRCDLFIYKNQEHGFFNKGKQKGNTYYLETLYEADVFLESLGYLKGKPTIKLDKK